MRCKKFVGLKGSFWKAVTCPKACSMLRLRWCTREKIQGDKRRLGREKQGQEDAI